MELDLLFDYPTLLRRGSQSNVEIIRHGPVMASDVLAQHTPFYFDGNLTYRTPFGQQEFDNLYTSVGLKKICQNFIF